MPEPRRLPRYEPGPGAAGLAARLKALLDGDHPVRCDTYVDLGAPSAFSSHHAETTFTLAEAVVAGRAGELSKFNSKPATVTRPYALASRGRADVMALDPADPPEDIDQGLWHEVRERARLRRFRDPTEAAAVSQLLLRLGFLRAALDTLQLRPVDLRSFRPDDAIATEQLHLLARASGDLAPLRELLFTLMTDRRYSPYSRATMAKQFVVSAGRRNLWEDRLLAAEAELLEVSEAMPDDFAGNLYRQTIFRAVSFVPFLRGDRERTIAYLTSAEECQLRAVPSTGLEFLLWRDYAFPLYETLHRTAEVHGDRQLALRSAEKLIAISPGDYRAWIAHLRLRFDLGDLDGALRSAERAIDLGGFSVAQAAFYASVIAQESGDGAAALRYRSTAARLDPDSPSLSVAVADLA